MLYAPNTQTIVNQTKYALLHFADDVTGFFCIEIHPVLNMLEISSKI